MKIASAQTQSFTHQRPNWPAVTGILPIFAFILAAIAGSNLSSFVLLTIILVVSFHRLSSRHGLLISERDAQVRCDQFGMFGLGLLHFAALPVALYSFTYEGQNFGNWLLHVLAFGAFFGTVAFSIGHTLIHSTNRLHKLLGRVIYSSMWYGTYVSAHLMVHHPRKGTERDPERVRTGETVFGYAIRVYVSGIRLGRRAESLRRKKFNHGQLDVIHPHAQYVMIALATGLICAALFGPMGLINLLAVSCVARMCALGKAYIRNK